MALFVSVEERGKQKCEQKHIDTLHFLGYKIIYCCVITLKGKMRCFTMVPKGFPSANMSATAILPIGYLATTTFVKG